MKLIKRYELCGHKISIANVDNNGEKLVIAYSNNIVKVYNIHSCECMQTLESQIKGITTAVFSHDSKQILTNGKNDKNARIWDVSSGKCIQTLFDSRPLVNSIN